MAASHKNLSKPHVPPRAVIRRAQGIELVENFYVGLPDTYVPLPQNVLLFASRRNDLIRVAKDTSHQRYLLVFNLEGAATVLLDGLMVRLEAGQAVLVLPFQTHRYLPEDTKRLLWVYVSFELRGDEAFTDMRGRSVDVPPDAWPLLDRLMAEYQLARASPEASGEVAALLSFLLLRLLRECRCSEATPWDPRRAIPAHRIVHRASHLVLTRITEPVSVEQIAAALHISAGYLRDCFHRVLGVSVSAHVRHTRIYAACALLSRAELDITRIAERCGFVSVYTFSRVFKRVIGSPPTAYRAHLWEQRNLIPKPAHSPTRGAGRRRQKSG